MEACSAPRVVLVNTVVVEIEVWSKRDEGAGVGAVATWVTSAASPTPQGKRDLQIHDRWNSYNV